MDVRTYIENQSPAKARLFRKVRSIILDAVPEAEAKLAYGVPFYYHNGRFAYMNSSAKGIYLGFIKGKILDPDEEFLQAGTRKEIRILPINSNEDLDEGLIRALILEAVELNQ